MATKLFLTASTASTVRGTNDGAGATLGWYDSALSTTRGAGIFSSSRATVAGPTAGLNVQNAGLGVYEWISEPLAADVTLAAANLVTMNVWMSENNMSANVGAQMIIDILKADRTLGSSILNSERGVELAVTTRAVNNWTGAPAAVTINRGDRIRVQILGNDVGTMAAAFTFDFSYAGVTAGADGDTWIEFVENMTFEAKTGTPAGTAIYPTATAAGINPGAATELEAWTSRGGGATTAVTNTATGWTAKIPLTATAGGTAVEWYSKPLTAFTLGGRLTCQASGFVSANSTYAVWGCTVYVCNEDGSSPVVWGEGSFWSPAIAGGETVQTFGVSGDDVSVTNGQRLKFVFFIDDDDGINKMVTGRTMTFGYAGSAGANGDCIITLPQSVSEYVAPPSYTPRNPGSDSALGLL